MRRSGTPRARARAGAPSVRLGARFLKQLQSSIGARRLRARRKTGRQRAISAEGFPLQLLSQTQLATLHGLLPARLGVVPTGFEFTHVDADDLMAKYSGLNFGQRWRYAASFRWDGAGLYQNPAVLMASAAYAKATGGMALDCVEGKLVMPQHIAEIAREFETDIPVVQEILRRVAEGHQAPASGDPSHTGADEPTHVVTGRWLNRPK